MKKALIAALAAVAMLSVAGCNSAGSTNAANTTAAGNANETEAPTTVRTLVGSWGHEMGYTYVFREDKTGEYLIDGNDEPFWVFTYETDGDKLTMYQDGSLLMETKYTIDGDTLIIEDSFGEKVYYTYKA